MNKNALLRFVLVDHKVLKADPGKILPGRGWYLCPEPSCLSLLGIPKWSRRAFGRPIEIGPELKEQLTIPPPGGEHGQN
jgi:predicted RNA-binding protein YlxR (DUF448 family)